MSIIRELRPAVSLVALFTLLTGFVLPVVFTEAAQFIVPYQANGSLITQNGVVVGSALIGQNFTGPAWFAPRPSALSGTDAKGNSVPTPYDASESGGANLAASSASLASTITARIAAYQKAFGPGDVPPDAVTSSASGLDPDISLANALRQAPIVAAARHLPAPTVTGLVNRLASQPLLGLIGTPQVNVLQLNLALQAAPSA
jgi:K+-transporting ATPase ATPase C chain